jgi:hypothetical protein
VIAVVAILVVVIAAPVAFVIIKKRGASAGYRIPLSEIDDEDLEDYRALKKIKW